MASLYAIVGAYGIGAWIAAMIVAIRWLLNERTRIATFLTIAGWAGVATIGAAIVAASA